MIKGGRDAYIEFLAILDLILLNFDSERPLVSCIRHLLFGDNKCKIL